MVKAVGARCVFMAKITKLLRVANPAPAAAGSDHVVGGSTAEGWGPVRAAFANNFALGLEIGAQLCVYVGGERVIDLHGSIDPHRDSAPGGMTTAAGRPVLDALAGYNANSIQQVFSSTKNLTAICMAMAVDRGLLDYAAAVASYWPEVRLPPHHFTSAA